MARHTLKDNARAVFAAALAAADPTAAVDQALRSRKDLDQYKRIFVVGAGKAGGTMARAAENYLGARITSGCINVKEGDTSRTRYIELRRCGHPVPDERGFSGAKRIAELCIEAGEGDLVICLFSGGASALMPYPASSITLEEKQETTKLLLACGAAIQEINTVRKHLSGIKGGQLARLAAPARVLSLILSDVVGDDPGVIASGPTAPDHSTFEDAYAVLEKYEIVGRVPLRVRERLRNGAQETPKEGDPVFDEVENVIVGSNQKSLEAAARTARQLRYHTLILSSSIEGETRDVARMHAAIARQIRDYGQPVTAPACIISGGETTVTIRGEGKGGRNQEFALAAAMDIAGMEDVLVMSVGTDGTDGPTDAAGAMVDGTSVSRGAMSAADALEANDSNHFFEHSGDLVVTGSTGTNVMDLHLVLVGEGFK
ncbi:MAG TPA: glycerate kinase [Bryobacteraceae bacterium]|jgi:hydroxypyruvate reductase|nr:glycerate kinase [Bryobacteraceae bacterium]